MKRFAVFDVDGTITRTSMLQLIAKELLARGHLNVQTWHEIDVLLHDFRQKTSDEDFKKYMDQAITILFKNLKDMPVQTYLDVVHAVVNRSLSNTYVYTRELIKNLKSHGYFLIAISTSEMRSVEQFTKSLGFDAAVGEILFKGDTVLSGEIEQLRKDKGEILRALIDKYQLDTKGSLAVGDTSGELPMLEMVDQAIAFNPNQSLYKVARDKGWLIVIERKDMVYGLESKDGAYVLAQTNV